MLLYACALFDQLIKYDQRYCVHDMTLLYLAFMLLSVMYIFSFRLAEFG